MQCRRHFRILIPQALDELDRECGREGAAVCGTADQGVRLGRITVDTQKSIGKGVRLLARGTTAHDACRGTAEVFNEYDPQRDCNRPQLADGQWLNALIGAHETPQCFRIESAVGVRDECPGHAEYAWIAIQRSIS